MRTLITISLLFVLAAVGSAQRCNFRTYSLAEGLPQSQIMSMCLDSKGFLWLGTYGGGLCRYDGYSFKQFTKKDGLPNNAIWDIVEDKEGDLWIATEGGLSRFDGANFQSILIGDGDEAEIVWSILFTKKDELIIGTSGNGIQIRKDDKFEQLLPESGYNPVTVNDIFEDKSGKLWIATYGEGVYTWKDGKLDSLPKDRLLSTTVNHITQFADGAIWFSTEAGVNILRGSEMSTFTTSNGLVHHSVMSCFQDSKGVIWITTFGGGITRIDGQDIRSYTEKEGLSCNYPQVVLEDLSGSLMFGTDGGGLVNYLGEGLVTYTEEHGLPSDMVMEIIEDRNGVKWIGTDTKGLVRMEDGEIEVINDAALGDEMINHLQEDLYGNIWIGSNNPGAKVYNGKTFTTYTTEDGLCADLIYAIFLDSKSNIWLCGEAGGITRIVQDDTGAPIEFTTYTRKDGLSDDNTYAITEDEKGRIYIGTASGLSVFEDGKFSIISEKNGLLDPDCIDVIKDKEKGIWVAGSSSVAHVVDGKVRTYSEKDGLNLGNLYSLAQGKDGAVYVGSEKGMHKLTFQADGALKSNKLYSSAEGFIGIECNGNASMRDREGNIWFGTIRGLTKYNPTADHKNAHKPIVQITNVQKFFKDVDWSKEVDEIENWSLLPMHLELDHDQNHLTFEYVGINFSIPEKVQYQFKLEGFDSDWSEVSSQRKMTYSNIPAGAYRFMVKAANEDGVWSEPKTFNFTVFPPFWQTWWFYSTCVLLIFVIGYWYTSYKTKSLEQAKLYLEDQVSIRTEEIAKQNKELEQLSLVASKTDNYVIITDKRDEIIWVNEGFTRITGYALNDVIGALPGEILVGKHTEPEVTAEIEMRKLRNQRFDGEILFYTSDGQPVWVSLNCTPIMSKNGELERYISIGNDVTKRKEIEQQIKQKNEDITASIEYAKHIQEAILPSPNLLAEHLPNSFLFFKPRDIVSGDFYWFHKINDVFVIVCADCTGHGVPGAFMSVIGNEFLHQVISDEAVTGPHHVLEQLDTKIRRTLHQVGAERESRDGMDMGILVIDFVKQEIQFAGAYRPAILVRDGKLKMLEAAKCSVGGHKGISKGFFEHRMPYQKGDTLYMFSDGITDQFGGPKGKKYLIRRFVTMILEVQEFDMKKQKILFESRLQEWMKDEEQVDDMCLIGVRL